ncbi:HNH endonuclease [Pseudomonas sp. PDM23]|uniref:HNH endonuclease n=1 Tax=unclassified Pseudomonas TaxID=196821 RepID=UPI00177FA789|nr:MULTISPECIES: HNH endonuclease [unclassified Pseudomonas]MBD9578630.1 HNH endonuclease [Pseudomonas sp. PDM23]MBD9674410.1 HNH endonuclease [Pseudomonas sp. PDM21]
MMFHDWLIAQGKSQKTIKHYTGAIDGRLKVLAMHLDNGDFALGDIKSSAAFADICQTFDPTEEILPLNTRGKDMYRRALVMYAEYRDSSLNEAALVQVDFLQSVQKALQDSSEQRRTRLAKAPKIPSKKTVRAVVFNRNPDVVAEVLLRAEGKCEGCKEPAPFKRKSDSSPYLEVHHRIPLAQNGEDTVKNAIALCPNCHRERHFG